MSSFASDNGFFFKPYVGADYQYTSISFKDIPGTAYNYGDGLSDSLSGGDVHIGARVHKYLGFEAPYFDTAKGKKSNIVGTAASSTDRLHGETFDAMGYLPITDTKVELIGTVGVARTTAKYSFSSGSGLTVGGSATETKGRIGAGAQYWVTNNLNVRALVRYQDASMKTTANDAVIGTLGVNWQF